MARRTDIDWKAIRDDYEVKGLGYRELVEKHGVSKGGISQRATGEGWIKSKYEPMVQLKVKAIQGVNEVNKEIMNLPPSVVQFVDTEVNRRIRIANLITDGIERSQTMANELLGLPDDIDDAEVKVRATIVALDTHSKVTQRNASVVFGQMDGKQQAMPEGQSKNSSIIEKLKAKQLRKLNESAGH